MFQRRFTFICSVGVVSLFSTVPVHPIPHPTPSQGHLEGSPSIIQTGTPVTGKPISSNSILPSSSSPHSSDHSSQMTFKVRTVLILVPTIVTDKFGVHIRGLRREAFHVFEDGREQQISTFEEVASTSGQFPIDPPKVGEFTNLRLSKLQHRDITLIALDTVNTPFLDQAYGRRELVKYLANHLTSGRPIGLVVMSSSGLRVVQAVGGVSDNLVKILKTLTGEAPAMQGVGTDAQASAATGYIPALPAPDTPPDLAMQAFVEYGDAITAGFQQRNAVETTLNSLLGIAWSLSGVPGRKSLLWVTAGFPFAPIRPQSVSSEPLSLLYQRALKALTDANVSVYAVDVRGLVDNSPISDVTRSSHLRTGSDLLEQMNSRSWAQWASTDTLREFAEMTGGEAFYNTNDVALSFTRALEDQSSYYLLGYYLDTHADHVNWRALKVEVDRNDVTVRARKGFFANNVGMHAKMARTSDVSYALTSPIEATGVPLNVRWAGISGEREKRQVAFIVHVPAGGLAIDPTAQNKMEIDLAAMAFTEKDSRQAGQLTLTLAKFLSDAQREEALTGGVEFGSNLELRQGQYIVRFVVRDNLTGKIGSVMAPISVD